jgi:hypothetical protein
MQVGTLTEQTVCFRRGAAAALAVLLVGSGAQGQSAEGLGMAEARALPSERVVPEELWAETLVHALGLEDGLPASATPADSYGLLCAEAAERALDTEDSGAGSMLRVAHPVAPTASGEPVRVVLEAPATALYQVQIEGSGLQRWSVDQRLIGNLDPTALGVVVAPRLLALRAGPHEFTGILVRTARVERVELAAYRPLCIAPADGWRTGRPLSHGAKARTTVRALGLERYLPEEGTVIEVEAERFDSVSQRGGRTEEGPGASGRRASEWVTAGDTAAEFAYRLRLPQPGLFTVEARVRGGGPQVWTLDGTLRTGVAMGQGWWPFTWTHVMTTPLSAGEHVLRALIPPGSSIDKIRLVARSAGDPDYVEVLEQMGLREGHVHAPVSRGEMEATLREPAFGLLAESFLDRAAAGGGEPPLVAIPRDTARLYRRPLSPILPAEL